MICRTRPRLPDPCRRYFLFPSSIPSRSKVSCSRSRLLPIPLSAHYVPTIPIPPLYAQSFPSHPDVSTQDSSSFFRLAFHSWSRYFHSINRPSFFCFRIIMLLGHATFWIRHLISVQNNTKEYTGGCRYIRLFFPSARYLLDLLHNLRPNLKFVSTIQSVKLAPGDKQDTETKQNGKQWTFRRWMMPANR